MRKPPWFGEWHHVDGFTEQTLGAFFTLLTGGGALVLARSEALVATLSASAFFVASIAFLTYGRRTFVRAWAAETKNWARVDHVRSLETDGERALAKIVSATTTGEYGNDLRVDLDVLVSRKGHEPYAATVCGVRCDPLQVASLAVGCELEVCVDPADPTTVVVPSRMCR